jgi:hypothetical protein
MVGVGLNVYCEKTMATGCQLHKVGKKGKIFATQKSENPYEYSNMEDIFS